jgi:hypothetical protein
VRTLIGIGNRATIRSMETKAPPLKIQVQYEAKINRDVISVAIIRALKKGDTDGARELLPAWDAATKTFEAAMADE